VLGLYAEAPQRVAEAVDALGDLFVGDALVATLDGDLVTASLGKVTIDKISGGIKGVWQRHATARIAKSGRSRPVIECGPWKS